MKTKVEILKKHMAVIYCGATRFDFLDEDELPLILKAMEEYANQSKWISVKDKSIPIDGKEYLTININQGNIISLVCWDNVHKYLISKGKYVGINAGTHWQPLPEPPK